MVALDTSLARAGTLAAAAEQTQQQQENGAAATPRADESTHTGGGDDHSSAARHFRDGVHAVLAARVELGLPGVRGAPSNTGEVRLRSDKSVEVKFVRARVEPPVQAPLSDALDQEIFGRSVDLWPLEGILTPLQRATVAVAEPAAEALGLQGGLDFDTPGGGASWLLTSYLDEDLRVSRGDGGGLFVLTKDP